MATKHAIHNATACPYAQNLLSLSKDEPQLETRLLHVEQTMAAVVQTVNNISKKQDEFTKASEIRTDNLLEKISHVQESRYGNLFPTILVVFTIISLAGALGAYVLRGQTVLIEDHRIETKEALLAIKTMARDDLLLVRKEAQDDLKVVNLRAYQSQYDKGKSDALMDGMGKVIAELNSKLQRETALTKNELQAIIRAVDEKVQIEAGAIKDSLTAEIANLKNIIDSNSKWRSEHTEKDVAFHGEAKARLDTLEKQLSEVESRQYQDRLNRIKP